MNYDWKNFTRYPRWSDGPALHGALKLSGHSHICAKMTTAQPFSKEVYETRLAMRGVNRFDHYGGKLKTLEKLDKEGLMMLDMDHILSAVFCPHAPQHGWYVEVYTNDREDPDWINFIKSCPYAKLIVEMKSRMGPYNIQHWLFGKEFADA